VYKRGERCVLSYTSHIFKCNHHHGGALVCYRVDIDACASCQYHRLHWNISAGKLAVYRLSTTTGKATNVGDVSRGNLGANMVSTDYSSSSTKTTSKPPDLCQVVQSHSTQHGYQNSVTPGIRCVLPQPYKVRSDTLISALHGYTRIRLPLGSRPNVQSVDQINGSLQTVHNPESTIPGRAPWAGLGSTSLGNVSRLNRSPRRLRHLTRPLPHSPRLSACWASHIAKEPIVHTNYVANPTT